MAQKFGVNPWTAIWVRPRETIQKIVNFDPRYGFIFLAGVYGFNMLMQVVQSLSLGAEFSLTGILVGALILSPFLGMLMLSIMALLLQWTGRWIGGKGKYLPIRAALAWSNVPNIVNIVLWLILAFYFKRAVFVNGFAGTSFQGSEMLLVTSVFLFQTILSIWSFIILIKSLGQVQGFSAWKGLFNVLIPFFMIGIAVWLVSFIVGAFKG
ncbi:MAG TPA: Yip1 family protein [Rhabdochlamydiaceae bacterium]|nr:Yip1 family protein [Rhabdochlamydiaceae bacterium]